jgi:hypothetical protein
MNHEDHKDRLKDQQRSETGKAPATMNCTSLVSGP